MIPAIIAAAGKSSRMGPPKQLLPWGDSTVLATVVLKLEEVGIGPIICILGRERAKIAQALSSTDAHLLENPAYATTEMIHSFQLGLTYLQKNQPQSIAGTLFSLGDQPHISTQTLRQIHRQIKETPNSIVIPSHNMRRGHPFYLPRTIWQDILKLGPDGTLRQVLHTHRDSITYVDIETDEILWDMDTPAEYETMRRRWGQR